MRLTRTEITGLVFGILPYWVLIGTSYQQTVNGQVTQASSINFFALVGGVVALGCAWSQLQSLRYEGAQYTPRDVTVHRIMIGVLCVLGVAQLIKFFLGAF